MFLLLYYLLLTITLSSALIQLETDSYFSFRKQFLVLFSIPRKKILTFYRRKVTSDHILSPAKNSFRSQRNLECNARLLQNSRFSEVCSGGELPEVEIVSLLEEQIPKYTLRADTLTEFGGMFFCYVLNFGNYCTIV